MTSTRLDVVYIFTLMFVLSKSPMNMFEHKSHAVRPGDQSEKFFWPLLPMGPKLGCYCYAMLGAGPLEVLHHKPQYAPGPLLKYNVYFRLTFNKAGLRN